MSNIPKITNFPSPPLRNDPQNFNQRADVFLNHFPTFENEINISIEKINENVDLVNEAAIDSKTVIELAPQVERNSLSANQSANKAKESEENALESANKAKESENQAKNSENQAKIYRDQASDIATENLAGLPGNAGDVFVKTDSSVEWRKIHSASVVTCSVEGSEYASSGIPWYVQMNAQSKLLDVTISGFEVNWSDGEKEYLNADNNNNALTSHIYNLNLGETISAEVVAVDNLGNKSPADVLFATISDIYIESPSIVSPENNAVDVPEQPVITLSPFGVIGGTDTHVGTSVRIKDADGMVVWEQIDGKPLNDITVPPGVLKAGETVYTIEAQYHGETYGGSAWGAPSTITTSPVFIPDFETDIGKPYGGGYVAGKIVSDYDGETYGIIVSDGGGDSMLQGGGTMNWRTSRTAVSRAGGVPPMTLADGRANHNAILALNDLASFPAFKWIEDNCNAGGGLNGHTDWYLPSRDELEILYRAFKPTTQDNNDGTRTASGFGGDGLTHGTNANSLPEGAGYTLTTPSQTAQAAFRDGGADAFEDSVYWSSTERDASFAWHQTFYNGIQHVNGKSLSYRVRAIRRIKL